MSITSLLSFPFICIPIDASKKLMSAWSSGVSNICVTTSFSSDDDVAQWNERIDVISHLMSYFAVLLYNSAGISPRPGQRWCRVLLTSWLAIASRVFL